ncbi:MULTISPECIES: DUF4870 domain-containing protein [Calothrix]|uniref:DUF4870 domain-containing protein n=2 Tax=Calothrix TaxID=1186 RepID=A0ABR8AHE5_9CYAN|nr:MULTISPECIES: DUF4870 domain-containing protein [Calothrix]MBD2198945.1 DUF4870 domain-containing protein [Calothrix parietina FACHB-288]MBD2227647.1 DUF4870 domain-containing protein [Calothrix anomala FACHB-343]
MREKPKQQMRIWAMCCHLSALCAWMLLFFLVFLGIPLYLPLNIFFPLIIWRLNKSKSPWVDFQGKESLNFQISLTVYILIIILLSLLMLLTICGISITTNSTGQEIKALLDILLFLWFAITSFMILLQIFLVTFAAVKAYNGEHYRYPWTVRFLR